MGCPDPLCHLTKPEGTLARQARTPVRVAQAPSKTAPARGTLPAPTPAAQAALLDRITKGKSALSIDVSAFTPNPAVADTETGKDRLAKGEAFRAQYQGYLKELAATPVGFKLLSDLDKSPHKTVIAFDLRPLDNQTRSDGDGASNKKGAAATITMNPSNTNYMDLRGNKNEPWMTERQKYGYYHELVHAWHITKGTQATGEHKGVRNAEWQATGFGPNADAQISDNGIRRALGKAERPGYNDVTY
jgi:hypothetical protein